MAKIVVRALGGPHLEPGTRVAVGYYNHKRRYPGDVFEVEESQFSHRWMEKVEGPVQVQPEPETEPGPEPKGKMARKARTR